MLQNHWKTQCFCVPRRGCAGQKRGQSYGYPETFKNVAQTIGFRNKSFSRQPVGGTVLPRGALDLLWERWETLETQRFPAAHAGQDSLRPAEHLAATRKSYGFPETFKNVAQTIGFP